MIREARLNHLRAVVKRAEDHACLMTTPDRLLIRGALKDRLFHAVIGQRNPAPGDKLTERALHYLGAYLGTATEARCDFSRKGDPETTA